MAKVGRLSALGVRVSLSVLEQRSTEQVLIWLHTHFANPNQVLPQAINRANERSFKTLYLALAEKQGLGKRLRQLFSVGELKRVEALSRQLILERNEEFRARCREEWSQLEVLQATDEDWLRSIATMPPITQSTDLLIQARTVAKEEAEALRGAGCAYLSQLMEIELPNAGGPLLLRIFSSFLRDEVMASVALTQMLNFTLLEELETKQNQMLVLLEDILNRLPSDIARNPVVQPDKSAVIRSADEQQTFEEFCKRMQALPEALQDPQINAALGCLGMAVGQFDKAETLFLASAANASSHREQAQAYYNAYQAALEQQRWVAAKKALLAAATLDPERFEPFPLRKYTPQEILGAGGFGTAFLCEDQHLGVPVVIKTLHQAALERNVREVFREARALQSLQHPNIIQVMHCDFADREETRPYLVMAYFPGIAFDEYLKRNGRLDVSAARQLVVQLAEGMQAAHMKGILHQDLKPANILVSVNDEGIWDIRIIDFGLALQADQVRKTVVGARFTGSRLAESVGGTYLYAAPEQLDPSKGKLGPHSDVFSFGKTICQAVFAKTHPTWRDWNLLKIEDEILTDILSQCIDEDIVQRISSFGALLEALQGHETELPYQQKKPTTATLQQEKKTKHRPKDKQHKSNYIEREEGTVIDKQTGLQWMRCSLGQIWDGKGCVSEAKRYTWEQAVQIVEELNALGGYAGYTDWSLPSLKELYSLVYCSSAEKASLEIDAKGELVVLTGNCKGEYMRPAIDPIAFPDTPNDWFWSSLASASSPLYAWGLSFKSGRIYYGHKHGASRIRLVRVHAKESYQLAKQGHMEAQYNLGVVYERGRGVKQDDVEALRWYRLAAEQGHAEAHQALTRKICHNHYMDLENGTVLAVHTNLQWMRCTLGQTWDGKCCVGEANRYTWEQALQAVDDLNRSGGYAGYTDWRLPSITELHTLVYCSSAKQAPLEFDEDGEPVRRTGHCQGDYMRPTIDLTAFPGSPNRWSWSSSANAHDSDNAWNVNFHNGQVSSNLKSNTLWVRLVRIRE